jgi:hypothetical protein
VPGFKTGASTQELASAPFATERDAQAFFEANLETMLQIQPVKGQYDTGPGGAGIADLLGIDTEGHPVVVELKIVPSQFAIAQAERYGRWLVEHHAQFETLARSQPRLRKMKFDWRTPRLMVIAPDFTPTAISEARAKRKARAISRGKGAPSLHLDLIQYQRYQGIIILTDLLSRESADEQALRKRLGNTKILRLRSDFMAVREELLDMEAVEERLQLKSATSISYRVRGRTFAAFRFQRRSVICQLAQSPATHVVPGNASPPSRAPTYASRVELNDTSDADVLLRKLRDLHKELVAQ